MSGVASNGISERLATLERNTENGFSELRTQVTGLIKDAKETQSNIVQLMTEIKNQPKFNPQQIVGYIKDIGILVAMGAGAIIWIATAINQAPTSMLQRDITYLDNRMDRMEKLYVTSSVAIKSDKQP